MSDKFKKPESNPLLNAVDYFNFFGSFVSIFEGIKQCNVKSETEVCLLNPESLDPQELNKPTFILNKLNTIMQALSDTLTVIMVLIPRQRTAYYRCL